MSLFVVEATIKCRDGTSMLQVGPLGQNAFDSEAIADNSNGI